MDKESALTAIESIMTQPPLATAGPSKSVQDIAIQMKERDKGGIIIVDNDSKPIGIITERDIVRKVLAEYKNPKDVLASDIMSQPLVTVGPEVHISEASLIMAKYNIRRLPIVVDNRLIGIVTLKDLGKKMYEKARKDPELMYMSIFPLLVQ
jgi:CBS domain-containing protein